MKKKENIMFNINLTDNANIQFNIKNRKIFITNIISLSFILLIVFGLLFAGLIATKNRLEINEYENRMANKISKPTIKTLLSGEFQENLDSALADQLPKSIFIKKIYNFGDSFVTKYLTNLFTYKYCENNYINYGNGILTYGCDDTLVYSPVYFEDREEEFENRINNINNLIKNVIVPVYVYYIEKDTDVNFIGDIKTNMSESLKEKINTDNFYIYRTNSFKDFKENFYKTDHHWNYKGSYEGYKELHDFLGLTDEVLKPTGTECTNGKWAGSKAKVSGAQYIYGENLCVYTFDFPELTVTINGEESNNYGVGSINELTDITYGNYYGWDNGEVIIDFNNPKKENILLIGDSYDNALLKLIGSHYNKLYALDFRQYYNEVSSDKFYLNKYIKENKIDKVVLIGHYGFFVDETFNIEA